MPTIDGNAFRSLLETVPDGFFVHDAAGRFLDVNARSCSDLGYTRAELLSRTVHQISGSMNAEENIARWSDASPGTAMGFREIAVRKDGSSFPVEIKLTCQMIEGQKLFFGLARDVSETAAELEEAHERMTLAVRVGGLGVWDYDFDRQTMQCDEQWHRIMGRDPARPVQTLEEFRTFIHPQDVERATDVRQTAANLIAEKRDYNMVFRILRPDGEVRWVRSAARVVEDGEGGPVRAVGFVVDITESRLSEARLHRQALEDSLTGLANRRGLDEELAKACLHAMRSGEPLALAMIDVDHFKLYNDEQGHVRGDEALVAVANILKGAARRPYDLAARYGGEEFLLLLPGAEGADAVVEGVVEAVKALRIPHPGSPVAPWLTVSCGCVIASEMADVGPLDLLAECDRALYRAKEVGRDRTHLLRL